MTKTMIEFDHVKKTFTYSSNQVRNLKKLLSNVITLQRQETTTEKLTVIDNVSFKINEGEFVGIMGNNGVGKSTLLKLISGIYFPDSGSIKTYGKFAPLLELGAGFSDDLSGYENIFLNASIIGFNRNAVRKSLDDIIEFSGLEDKIHLPIRNFSSGMLVRLGFSIAVFMDAPILLFDEILAVGDIAFQQKCLDKVQELHEQGRTILLVSHSPEQIKTHCNRCIVLSQGGVEYDGDVDGGIKVYMKNNGQA